MKSYVIHILTSALLAVSLQACGSSTRVAFNPAVPNPYKVKAENIDKPKTEELRTGAEQTELYVPYLKGKRVGMVVNPTSIIGKETTVDSLLALGVNVVKIFGPEHGFRGDASNGTSVNDEIDAKTGIKVSSL
jgi:uncharacterized protein YbbC (DUF1343 family)